jgi:hypothetical protein
MSFIGVSHRAEIDCDLQKIVLLRQDKLVPTSVKLSKMKVSRKKAATWT